MAYADAVNEEINEMKEAGADVIQIDEPHMQAHPIESNRFGVAAIDKALEGISGTTVVHLCFGYAYVISDKPSGYSFLPELDRCAASAISIEAAEPSLDPSILEKLPNKKVLFGVVDLGDQNVETSEINANRLRGALRHIDSDRLIAAPDCGLAMLDRDSAMRKMTNLAAAAHGF